MGWVSKKRAAAYAPQLKSVEEAEDWLGLGRVVVE